MTVPLNNEEDNRQYLLSDSELRNFVQQGIDLQVTGSRMNDARIRNQLDPYNKNVVRSQNPTEFFFRGKSKYIIFRGPILGSR